MASVQAPAQRGLRPSSASRIAPQPAQRRPSRCIRTQFSFISKLPLPSLFGPSSNSQQQQQQQEQQQPVGHPLYSLDGFDDQGDLYSSLLQQAEEITFNISPAAEQWAERRMLQEAERMLEICIQERPAHLQPRVLLLRNLMRQSEGREADVPALALQALQEADLPDAEASMMRHLHALQIVMLGLKALYKLRDMCESSPMRVQPPAYTVKSFLAEAQAAAPSFAADFDKLALRVKRQLVCCSDEQRGSMLADRDGYMSSVDLSAVYGQHHVVVGRGDGAEPGLGM